MQLHEDGQRRASVNCVCDGSVWVPACAPLEPAKTQAAGTAVREPPQPGPHLLTAPYTKGHGRTKLRFCSSALDLTLAGKLGHPAALHSPELTS